MFTVVHEGTCVIEAWPAVVEEIGPNGSRSLTQRLEPGYLGCLLLNQPDAERAGWTRFILLDMWDERYVGPAVADQALQLATVVDWLRAPSAFITIR